MRDLLDRRGDLSDAMQEFFDREQADVGLKLSGFEVKGNDAGDAEE